MRICPYCDTEIPDKERSCPSCGERYWESDDVTPDQGYEETDEAQGCLSIFALHFLVALCVFVFFLFAGFILNLLVHFEENQVKVIWIGAAFLLAVTLPGFIARLKKKKKDGK